MSLTPEWRDRLNAWRQELKNHFYRKLASVPLEGFVTTEHLTPQRAEQGRFKPVGEGARWGAKWEYGWYRCDITLPRAAADARVAFRSAVGGECLVFVNGVARGALSPGRSEITLTRDARPGQRFHLLLEAYAGNGPWTWTVGPLPEGRISVPEPPAAQQTVGETSFGLWDETAFQLSVDVETLLGLRNALDPSSLRVAAIDAGLRNFATIVDFELPHDEMIATFRAARARLAPLLKARNGSTMPELFGFGHGHLDIAWLWPLAETERKAARTFSSQLELMAEYPRHRFLQSQPHLYWMCKRHYPEIYARVKKAVKAGQLIPEGSMWVEPDMNIAGGEALIRQCIHGKRFFKQEFGVTTEILWLPDVFGYSAALPQILRGCGVKYFATAKIFWNYHGGEGFPYNTFTWEGIDGTGVLAHLFPGYGGGGAAAEAVQRWNGRPQKDGISSLIFCFGQGDGGGGPTRESVENVRRLGDLEGCPRVRLEGPLEFFKDLEKRGVPDVRYVGELYFQAHRGTYTSQARTKKGNRKSELAMREAELWSVAAMRMGRFKYPASLMDETWKMILLNQFHDILPGSSIARVYEEAEASFAEVIRRATEVADSATSALTKKAEALTVFNSLGWERTELVELPEGLAGGADHSGIPLPSQRVGRKRMVEVKVPSCGWTTVVPATEEPGGLPVVEADGKRMENDRLRLRWSERGELVSIFDKEAGRELAAGPCNSFRLYKDVPGQWDAWDIDSLYRLTPVALNEKAQIRVITTGPLMAQVRVERKLHDSTMSQMVTLRRGSRRVDFQTTIDWHESHKMLKVAFPVTIHANEAYHEIQFGHLRRPNHYSRQYDADRFKVSNHKWSALVEENRGVAILNDCKYGLNVLGNTINLTLLRPPKAPDMNADQGVQEFTYSFYAWNGSLADSGVVRAAYELNVPVLTALGAAGERSLFSVDSPQIIIEAVKSAEDGTGDVIIRMYESMRSAADCVLTSTIPLKSAQQVNMLEDETQAELRVRQNEIRLRFRPFEIKTVRLK